MAEFRKSREDSGEPVEDSGHVDMGRRSFSRKKQRKMDRQQKKVKKLAWYTHKKVEEIVPKKRGLSGAGSKRKNQTEEDPEVRAAKRARLLLKEEEKAARRVEELRNKMKQKRIQKLQEENEAESRLIKKLEKQLHLNKRKNKSVVPASFAHDGLDYLLEVLENPESEMGMDFDEDVEADAPVDHHSAKDSVQEATVDDADMEEAEDDDDQDSLEEDFGDSDENDEEGPEVQNSDTESFGDSQTDPSAPAEPAPLREDIYGRIRDSVGNVVKPDTSGKYIPPGRKNSAEVGSEAQIRLERQLKGLLNRLTEANMAGIVSQVEQLFATNSRHDMNETVISMVFSGCVTRSLMPKRLALEHGMFMALLYQKIGAETGAAYMQRLLRQYDDLVSAGVTSEQDKHLDNVLLLWCHAYNFKILHASMIFDILGELASRFTEKDIDMILLVLREVGFSLRKDDPVALKNLIGEIQAKTSEKRIVDPAVGSRVAFMMDIVTAIKNNNMKKIPNYDPSEFEHLVKVYRTLIHKGHVMETPLKISLADLRLSGERGKWWVVGAAWNKPDLPVIEDSDKKSSVLTTTSFSGKLLELAAQQRMNTDVRKAIFCAVMSAEDYNEAFESVMKLNLKNAQEAEIFHVLLHCGLNEAHFNPFYSFVLEKFCQAHRSYQRQLLFVLWDKIRDLPSLTPGQLKNLAHIVAHGLINNQALPITALKKINFAEMNPAMVKFLRMVLASLLLTPSSQQVKSIFSLLAEKKYKMFRESLRLFLRHFMTRNSKKVLKGDFAKFSEEFLKGRIDVAEKSLMGGFSL